jgi:hypothetical protein
MKVIPRQHAPPHGLNMPDIEDTQFLTGTLFTPTIQIKHPSTLAWEIDQLLPEDGEDKANRSNAVLLTSSQGMELKGAFVRAHVSQPEPRLVATGEAMEPDATGGVGATLQQQHHHGAALFLGSPRMAGLAELKVGTA